MSFWTGSQPQLSPDSDPGDSLKAALAKGPACPVRCTARSSCRSRVGGTVTVLIQDGRVTAVSRSSITLKSDDGFTRADAVTGPAIVVARRDGTGSVNPVTGRGRRPQRAEAR